MEAPPFRAPPFRSMIRTQDSDEDSVFLVLYGDRFDGKSWMSQEDAM